MRNRHVVFFASCAATAVLMVCGIDPLNANEDIMRATVDKPAILALPAPTGSASTAVGARIVITINEYEPSKNGPVAMVVSLRCHDDITEIGRFGIFPDMAFSTARGADPQRFGFPLPKDSLCQPPQVLIIGLEPQSGSGAGASITAGSAAIE